MSTSAPTTIAILGAAFNTPNMGVSVLAAGAIRTVLRRFPNANVVQVDYAIAPSSVVFHHEGRDVSVSLVNLRFSKRLFLPNNIALLLVLAAIAQLLPMFHGIFCRMNSSYAALSSISIAMVVAGGDSFSDIYGMSRLFYVTLPAFLLRLLGKRLVFLPQTIGPFRRRTARAIASYLLRQCDQVFARDEESLARAHTLLGERRTRPATQLCYDLGFDVKSKAPARTAIQGLSPDASRRPLVGINVSGLLWIGGYTQNNMFSLSTSYSALVSQLIEAFVRERETTILLVPHVYGSETDNESDVSACLAVFQALPQCCEGRVGLLAEHYEYDELRHIIGQCDFFIGSRMHACIGALAQGVPALSIAYSDKFVGVLRTIGHPDLVVDPRVLSSDDIVQSALNTFDKRTLIQDNLRTVMPSVVRTIRTSLDAL